VALVSDAGTPGLSDPGYKLVQAAIASGYRVVPIPGPSALTSALVASGLPTDAFLYLGFFPRRATDRGRLLADLADQSRTIVAFESAHRLLASLKDVESILGDRQIVIARELTKLHEEIWRGSVSAARAYFEEEVRGEITLVIAGAETPAPWDKERVEHETARLLAQGLSRREAAKQVAQISGWSRRNVYQLTLDMKQTKDGAERC
jgi:16S rRNA (cytidine1402-2'-O)-methyltransferase